MATDPPFPFRFEVPAGVLLMLAHRLPWSSLPRVAAIGVLLTCLGGHAALTAAASELEFATERAVVFKDGYALLVKRAVGTTDSSGRLYSDQVPDEAVLGSIWIDSAPTAAEGEPVRLKSLTAKREESESIEPVERTCRTLIELLQANLGRSVTLSTGRGEIDGELVELIGQQIDEMVPVTGPRPESIVSVTTTSHAASHLVLRSGGRESVLPIGEILRVHAEDLATRLTIDQKTKRSGKRWVLQFDRPETEVEVRLIYFRSGIRWIPTYRIELGDDPTTAVISMQAELLNEAESLTETAVDLVVGVPNFRFRDTPSPLTLEAAMRMTLQQAAPQLMNNAMRNSMSQAMFTQRAGEEYRDTETAIPDLPRIPSELNGVGAQDLFVIHLDAQTLGKGERAAVPISRSTVPCRHVYTWKVALVRNDSELSPTQSGSGSPLQLTENEVWHQLELTNTTDAPWTTGAAMLLDSQQPLAQELLTYTSPGATVRIPVTVAIDLRGAFDESEVGRTTGALQWDGWTYTKIDKQSLIELTNRKREAIEFEIECHVPGKVDSATVDGKIQILDFVAADWQNYRGSAVVNQHSVVRWRGKLEPGERFEATVDSHYFARQ